MSIDIIRRLGLMAVFILVQVLVLNHIHLFYVATPVVYVYFVLLFPRNHKRWLSIVMSFFLGLILDSFNNTPGEAAFSLTLLAFLQPYIMELYLERDDSEGFVPGIASMGALKYVTFVLLLTFVYCFTLFTIEAFTFFNWLQWLLCVFGCWLITSTLIIVIDSIRR